MAAKGPSRRWALLPVVLLVLLQLLCAQLDLPLAKLVRNVFSSSTPPQVQPKYSCAAKELDELVTIVVTVKDACSQMPGFVARLLEVVGPNMPLIITYPGFSWCAPDALGVELHKWSNATSIPLPPRSSPIQGWVDASKLVKTPYSLLLHNDGYAIDNFFVCELVGALRSPERKADNYVVAAPMLFESKADGSLASHATQSRLRLEEGVVRHDHSAAKALDRGFDRGEEEQADFLEDHGFLIETDKISEVVDAEASYTLEYVDMILSLKQKGWKVLFVPTARLEFRIAEFSWRDVPYFAYKRSEATCHGTRDYLTQKWSANWPNTGFWTYIKYTIVEAHSYGNDMLEKLPWEQHASLFLGFFHLAGFNRYTFASAEQHEYVDLLHGLDQNKELPGEMPKLSSFVASRQTQRKSWPVESVRPVTNGGAAALLPGVAAWRAYLPSIEADLPLEYMPFAVAEVSWPGKCSADEGGLLGANFDADLCGVAAQHAGSCSCWVNLPTFKTRGSLVRLLAKAASALKLPSRVTTYVELVLGSANSAEAHVEPLRQALEDTKEQLSKRGVTARIFTCGGAKTQTAPLEEPCGSLDIAVSTSTRLFHFSGKPPAPAAVADAVRDLAAAL
ncbi:hypothetical protein M885DRAFT_518940 [Pelagophyceae sp. CCMP2097]|nr:hypothetical protein M885DRAFT_518940 [Pelagophyceae sp. CCMP2097]